MSDQLVQCSILTHFNITDWLNVLQTVYFMLYRLTDFNDESVTKNGIVYYFSQDIWMVD